MVLTLLLVSSFFQDDEEGTLLHSAGGGVGVDDALTALFHPPSLSTDRRHRHPWGTESRAMDLSSSTRRESGPCPCGGRLPRVDQEACLRILTRECSRRGRRTAQTRTTPLRLPMAAAAEGRGRVGVIGESTRVRHKPKCRSDAARVYAPTGQPMIHTQGVCRHGVCPCVSAQQHCSCISSLVPADIMSVPYWQFGEL